MFLTKVLTDISLNVNPPTFFCYTLSKYQTTGQTRGLKKLIFLAQCLEKETELIKLGVNTFVYRSDIEEYIDNVTKDVVKIIYLKNYEREIPDEIDFLGNHVIAGLDYRWTV